MENPLLSVAMLVYNGEKYLREAIDTVLDQTFSNYEFIIINDGSTDGSLDIINSYSDPRIRLVNNERNFGIPYSRNLALRVARGRYFAWSDCDDINLPARFDTQIKFLQQNEQFGVCGTWMVRFSETDSAVSKSSTKPEVIKSTLLFKPAVWNATAMYRLDKIRQCNLTFNPNLAIAEDYEFYLKSSMFFPLANIPAVLYKYRASETSIMKSFDAKDDDCDKIHYEVYSQALNYLKITPQESDLKIHRLIGSQKIFTSYNDYKACYKWLKVLRNRNAELKVYELNAFNQVLREQFFFISKKASRFGYKTLMFYLVKAGSDFGLVNLYKVFKLSVRCSIRYNKF